jgi:hypothetical protein
MQQLRGGAGNSAIHQTACIITAMAISPSQRTQQVTILSQASSKIPPELEQKPGFQNVEIENE